ncbi:corrinoid protein [bacterium]|nr:corrinoid protein [bacterium]
MSLFDRIRTNVIEGRKVAEDEGYTEGLVGQPAVSELVLRVLEGEEPEIKEMIDSLSSGMEEVGRRFEQGEYFIPDMLASAEAVGEAMDLLEPHLKGANVVSKGVFIMATVAGDLHDIGKNIVAIMLKGAGFKVVDLGSDVAASIICEAVKREEASFVGLSALLTTTMQEMGGVIRDLEEAGLRKKVKVLVGGAPLSSGFADQIGADAYCEDAFEAVRYTEEFRR